MRCFGRTKNLTRCKNNCKFILCRHHKLQWWGIILIIATLGGIYQDVIKPSFGYFEFNKPKPSKFESLFKSKDNSTFNILITRFEDYISKEETYCIGRSIEEHLNIIKSNSKKDLNLNVIYADSISPAKSSHDAIRIQKKHNADLIIYGLAQNIIPNCGGAEICFRYNINELIFPNKSNQIKINTSKHDIDYIKTTPFDIQKGILQVDAFSMRNWITTLVGIKKNELKSLEIDISSILKNNSLTDKEKRMRIYPIGDLYLDIKNYSKAIDIYNQIVEIKPTVRAYRNIGIAYSKMQKFELAERTFKKAFKINPNSKTLFVDWGNMYFDKENYSKAIKNYNFSLKVDSTRSFVYRNLGLAYQKLEAYSQALKYYNLALDKDSLNAFAYAGVGHVYKKQKLNKKAIKYYTKAIRVDSSFYLPYAHRGYVYLRNKENIKAIKDLTKFITVDSTDYIDFSNRASAYKSIKEYDKAIIDSEKSLSLNPKDDIAYWTLGDVYLIKEKYKKAIENYSKSINLDSSSAVKYLLRGKTYLNLKKYNKSIYDFNKAILIDSINSNSYNSKGIALELLNRNNEALENYHKSIEIDSTYASPVHNIGNINFKKGDYNLAVKYLKKAVKLESKNFHYNFDLYHFLCWKYWFFSLPIILIIVTLVFRKIFFRLKKK